MLPVVAAESGVLGPPRGSGIPWSGVFWQGLANGAVGLLAYQAIDTLPGLIQRRRMRFRR
jgi:hypothetical protein